MSDAYTKSEATELCGIYYFHSPFSEFSAVYSKSLTWCQPDASICMIKVFKQMTKELPDDC